LPWLFCLDNRNGTNDAAARADRVDGNHEGPLHQQGVATLVLASPNYDREAITKLVRNADLLSGPSSRDAALPTERAHLTATAARQIAREAGVRWVEPSHFFPRYAGEDERLQNEVF
jgi:hypothetical protein